MARTMITRVYNKMHHENPTGDNESRAPLLDVDWSVFVIVRTATRPSIDIL
jgi:hypothetical protein